MGRIVIMIAGFALLAAIAGCGGISFKENYSGYRTYDDGQYRYSPSSPYYDPLVRYPAVTPIEQPVGFIDNQLSEYQLAWQDYFDNLRVEAGRGLSVVPNTQFLFASRNVQQSIRRDGSTQVTLASDRNSVSFVSYGLTGAFGDEQVTGISILGDGSFLGGEESGVYVGVRQFNTQQTRWFGPVLPGENLYLQPGEGAADFREVRSYLTLAVFNGDKLVLDGIEINVDYAPVRGEY